jgi:isoleucyl-tRNA synthetase
MQDDEQLLAEWEKLRTVRDAVLKSLEEVRQGGTTGNSLEAKVVIRASGETAALLRRHENDLRFIFIVSQVSVEDSPGAEEGPQIEVLKADGSKCERCWNYSVAIGKDSAWPTLCERCIQAIQGIDD